MPVKTGVQATITHVGGKYSASMLVSTHSIFTSAWLATSHNPGDPGRPNLWTPLPDRRAGLLLQQGWTVAGAPTLLKVGDVLE